MLKYVLASLMILSTLVLAAPANAQGFWNNRYYYNRGTFVDRLLGNGGYGYNYNRFNPGFYPGNSYFGHHHHHCGGGYAYRGWGGRRWY